MSKPTDLTRRHFTRMGMTAGLGLFAAGCTKSAAEAVKDKQIVPMQALTEEVSGLDNSQLVGIKEAGLERRVSGFRGREWQEYFGSISGGAILVDTHARCLHFWSSELGIYKIYPTSVPITPELTRTGRTRVVQKREGPDWRPTPNMLKRDPSLPAYVGPGPQNPLGTHALYLSWQYYRIHGTNDVRKIGRKSSNGCIGLYNEDIAELFGWANVGTQVLVV